MGRVKELTENRRVLSCLTGDGWEDELDQLPDDFWADSDNNYCPHHNTKTVLLFTSTVIECQDCKEVLKRL